MCRDRHSGIGPRGPLRHVCHGWPQKEQGSAVGLRLTGSRRSLVTRALESGLRTLGDHSCLEQFSFSAEPLLVKKSFEDGHFLYRGKLSRGALVSTLLKAPAPAVSLQGGCLRWHALLHTLGQCKLSSTIADLPRSFPSGGKAGLLNRSLPSAPFHLWSTESRGVPLGNAVQGTLGGREAGGQRSCEKSQGEPRRVLAPSGAASWTFVRGPAVP